MTILNEDMAEDFCFGCHVPLTSADYEAGKCTQCGTQIFQETFLDQIKEEVSQLDADGFEDLLWHMAALADKIFEESGDNVFRETRDSLVQASTAVHNRSGN